MAIGSAPNALLEDSVLLGSADSWTVVQLLGLTTAEGTPITGAALTGNAATADQGTWQFSTNGGRSWIALPTNLAVDGSAALLLSADTLLRFSPAPNFNGTPGGLNLRPVTQSALPWVQGGVPYGNSQGYIATWASENQDGSVNGIYAQRYAADGSRIGTEFRVNTTTFEQQYFPDVTQLSGGRFLISWQSNAQDGNSWGIYGQLYNPDGTALGSEFRVNTTTNDQQTNPVIASLADGGFVASWMSYAQDGSGWGVYAQRYDANGAKAGVETLVNTSTISEQQSPAIAVLNDGSYVIAFQGVNHSGGSGWDIYAQRFSTTGTQLGGETRLNDAALGYSQYEPSIAALTNGGYVVTWQDDGRDGSSWGIYARTFAADGTATAPEFRVNTTTNSDQSAAEVAVLADGSFVITWRSYGQSNGNQWDVYAQRFSADGNTLGAEFRVNTTIGNDQLDPDISALSDGTYVITWQSNAQDGSGWGAYAQRFKADGSKVGQEIQLNTYWYNSQHQVKVSAWGLPLHNLASLGLNSLADPVTLSINVTPVNDRPALTGTPVPLAGAAAGQTFSFSAADLLGGYGDVDGDALSITAVTLINSASGSLTGNPALGWSFTPASGYTGTVDLAFSVSDGTVSVNDNTSFTIGTGTGGSGTANNDLLIGTSGADNLAGGAGDDIIDGMAGDDNLTGDTGFDQLRGGAGNDIISGGDQEDVIHGGDGNDRVSGDAGDDQLFGGRGDDAILAGSGDDVASGDGGRDAIKGGMGSDVLLGGEGDDFLYGEDGEDLLNGGAGNDLLIGGIGSDNQIGDLGDDIFLAIGNSVSDDVFDGGEGTDTLVTGAQSLWNDGGSDFSNALLRSIERLELLPSPGADNLINYESYRIEQYATRGSRFTLDQINSFAWIGATNDVQWSNGLFSFSARELSWDWPASNWRALRISGEGTIDLTASRWDANTLFRIRTEVGKQTLLGSAASDWFAAGDGNDILSGKGGDDILLGEAGDDTLSGDTGNDRLEGGLGIDTLIGGEGDDVLIGGGSNDRVFGDAGIDTIELNWGRINIAGGGFSDYFYDANTTVLGSYDGGTGNDTLRLQVNESWGIDRRGQGQTIDLRSASISNFERFEVGTSAIIRLTGSQYSQFINGVSKATDYNGSINLAIDLNPGEELRFSRTAGLNSASGALKITGTGNEFVTDVLGINSDTRVDLSDPATIVTGVEKLQVQRGTVILNAEMWNGFNAIEARGSDIKKIIITNYQNIDLTKFQRFSDSNTTLELQLTPDQINTLAFESFSELFRPSSGSGLLKIQVVGGGRIELGRNKSAFELILDQTASYELIGTASSERIEGSAQADWIKAEGGNDRVISSSSSDTIDGGEGEDTLIASASDNGDYSNNTFYNIETLDVNGRHIKITTEQFNGFQRIIGDGVVELTNGGIVSYERKQGGFVLKTAQEPTTLTGTTSSDSFNVAIEDASNIHIEGLGGHDVLNLSGNSAADLDTLSLASIEEIRLDGGALRLSSEQLKNSKISGRGLIVIREKPLSSIAATAEDDLALKSQQTSSISNIVGATTADGTLITGAALTGNAATADQGTWQFSTNGGRSWIALPTNLAVDGSAALLLSADTLLRFSPAPNFNGTPGGLNLRPVTQSALPWVQGGVPYGNNQGYIATWISDNQDGSGGGIYAQRYAADGSRIGTEFRVNTTTIDTQSFPDVTQLTGGRFLISWQSNAQDGNSWGIYGQLYNPDGTALGSEFRVNTTTNDQQTNPVIASLADGGFVASWMSYAQDGSGWGVYAQRYDANGAKAGAETLVNTSTISEQQSPAITVLNDGSYVIAFQGVNHSGGSGWDIYAQRFSATGTKLGGETRLNDAALGYSQYEPSIAALTNGGYVVTWQDDGRDGSSWGIYARTFAADGTATAPEFRVNTTTNSEQWGPEVAVLADGSFVITWRSYGQSNGNQWDVYAQRFSADGNRLGTEFRVNTYISSDQPDPDITALADGSYIITWQSNAQDGSDWGAYGQRFQADGTKLGSEVQLNTYWVYSQHQVNVSAWGLPLQNLPSLGLNSLADPVTLSINVTPVNDRPALTGTPVPLTGAAAGQTFSFSAADLLSGYNDIDGDTLSITAVTLINSASGSLTGNPALGWTFTPASGYTGTVDLAFSVSDGTVSVNDSTSFTIGTGTGGSGTANNDLLIGTSGADNLAGGAGDDIIDGMAGDDNLTGDTGFDQLRGGAGNDIISGGDQEDVIHGGDGDDRVSGDAGDDQLFGGRGDDAILAGSGDDVASGDGGRDAIKGGMGSDVLLGGEGDDFLYGEDGEDLLNGGAGNDLLIGGIGSDNQIGDLGDDIFLAIGNSVSDDVFDAGEGTDTLVTGAQSLWNDGGSDFSNALLRSIERLELLPSPGADNLINYESYRIEQYATRGSRFTLDQINSFAWIGATKDVQWSNGLFSFSARELSWDSPASNWRALRISGEGTIDLTASRWDANTLFRIRTEVGKQTLLGSVASDWFAAGDGNDILSGKGGDDILLGEAGDDTLSGDTGNDRLEGGLGIDTLIGGEGDDVLIGGGSNDRVFGDAGIDTIELNWGRINIAGGGFSDYFYDANTTVLGSYDGGTGNDTLRLQVNESWGIDRRGQGQTIDLRSASISNFERFEVGTSAIIRLTGSQYSQFINGVSKANDYYGSLNLAIDLNPGEELTFARAAGINSAGGALKITGATISDTLSINSDGTVDLTNPGTTITGVEKLQIQRGIARLTGAQWNSLTGIEARDAEKKRIIITATENIDLAKFSRVNDSNTTLELSLTVDQINSDNFAIFANRFSSGGSEAIITITGSGVISSQEWPASIKLNTDSATFAPFALTGDEQDNQFTRRILGPFSIDGGQGTDTLVLRGDSDLSQGSLISVENLDLNGQMVTLTVGQFNALEQINGTGLITVIGAGRLDTDKINPTDNVVLTQKDSQNANGLISFIGNNTQQTIDGDTLLGMDSSSLGIKRVETTRGFTSWVTPEGMKPIGGGFHPGGDGRVIWGGTLLRLPKGPDIASSLAAMNQLANRSGMAYAINGDLFEGDRLLAFFPGKTQATIIEVTKVEGIATGDGVDALTLTYWDIEFTRSSDTIYGKNGNDVLKGGLGNDALAGGLGNDRIEGGSGVNTAIFTGKMSEYSWTLGGKELAVEHLNGGSDGTDTLLDIHRLQFTDTTITIDDIGNYYDTALGANSEIGKRNRGKIDYSINPSSPWEPNSDWDNLSFELLAGTQVEVTKQIYEGSPAGAQVRFDGDFALQPWELQGVFSVSETKVHNIRITGTKGVDYGVTFRVVDDKPNNTSTTARFADTQSPSAGVDPALLDQVQGFIGYQEWGIAGLANWNTTDIDWIRVDLIEGIQYEFKALGASSLPGTGLKSGQLQRLIDPRIRLLDEQGIVLANGQLGGAGFDPSLAYRADRTGVYFLAVDSTSGLYTGSYAVTRTSLDDFSGDINTNGILSVNSLTSGLINSEGDQDWFRISLKAGERVILELLGSSTSNGELRDPWLGIYSSGGQLLAADNNGGRGLDSRLSWAAPSDGNYYVAAGSLGSQGRGSYTLRASQVIDNAPDRLSSTFNYELLIPGNQLNADIEVRSDHDWYQTILQAGKTYKITVSGNRSSDSTYDPLRDPAITLRDTAGRLIAFDDDSGDGLTAELIYTADATNKYYLEVQDATDRYDGHYQLKIAEAVDDYGDIPGSAYALQIQNPISTTGEINYRGDKDLFAIRLDSNQLYKFSLRGIATNAGNLPDPFLRIWNSYGILVNSDDNSGEGSDASLYYYSQSAETVYLDARSIGGQTGSYVLEASRSNLPADDYGSGIATNGILAIGGRLSGSILTQEDSDWFRIELKAGEYYRFLLEGMDSGLGTLSNPYLELRSSTGQIISFADNGTLTRNAALGLQAENTGIYFIAARGSSAQDTGSYTLTSIAPDEAGAGPNTSQDLTVGEVRDAAIQFSEDADWFHISATENEIYSVRVTPKAGGTNQLSIIIAELFDSTGTPISASDGRFTDGSAQVSFRAKQSGDYYVAVRGYNSRTGDYAITLEQGNIMDDVGNTQATSKLIAMDSSTKGVLEIAGDRDIYSINVEAGKTYRISLRGSYGSAISPLVDPHLNLLDSSYQLIASNDNFEDSSSLDLNSGIVYTATQTGIIYLDAGSSLNQWQGAYQLDVESLGDLRIDDHVDTYTDDPVVLIAGQPRTGMIGLNNDHDLFTLNLSAGVTYQLRVRGLASNGGTLQDPEFRLLDANGQVVAAAFDGPTNKDASLRLKIQSSGRYYLDVTGNPGILNIGSYTAELIESQALVIADDLPADRSTSQTLASGASLEGVIGDADDVDWIKVQLEAGKLYIFDAFPRADGSLASWNPALELINESGIRIQSDADSGSDNAARIIFQPGTSGLYFLAVRSQDGTTGTYELKQRLLMSGSADPLLPYQWYINNPNGLDLNLDGVWESFSGSGVRIGVIDDGINYAHPDLIGNLDLVRDRGESWTLSSGLGAVYDDAFFRIAPKPESGHGTAVTGLIAATKNNEKGIAGVAYDATVAGFEFDWTIPALASMLRQQLNNSIGGMDITNNSWGFTHSFADDFNAPLLEPLAESLRLGVQEGRLVNGTYLGLNWVFAAGNNRTLGDSTNYHNFQNSRFVTTVASTGSSGHTSWFSSPGASILVSAFGEGLYTTSYNYLDGLNNNNYGYFGGTSGAAPLVAGVIALMLEANPYLGYRDIQSILAYSARQVIGDGFKFNGAPNWNGGGLHISHDQGFGLVDAHAAVRLAETWSSTLQTATNEQVIAIRPNDSGQIPDNNESGISFSVLVERDVAVEWVEVELDILHEQIADLVVELISPAGTVVRLVDRPSVTPSNPTGSSGPYSGLPDRVVFTTSASLLRGEGSQGQWTMRVRDAQTGVIGTLRQWGLKIYGSENDGNYVHIFTDEYANVASTDRQLIYDQIQLGIAPSSGIHTDTINASAVTSNSLIDLKSGSTSRIALRDIYLDHASNFHNAVGGDGDDFIIGNLLNNNLIGGRGNDRFTGGGGNDKIDGGFGFDQVLFSISQNDAELLELNGKWTIRDKRPESGTQGHLGSIELTSIEQLVYLDSTIMLNLNNNAPSINKALPNIGFGADVVFAYKFDQSSFVDPDVINNRGDSLSFTLKRSDGRSLPGWLKFDPYSLELFGEPFAGVSGVYELEMIATDSYGAKASQRFNLSIAGTSNQNQDPIQPSNVAWDISVLNSLEARPILNVGDKFWVNINASDISDPSRIKSTFSAYADLYYNPDLLRAVSIEYGSEYNLFRSGIIDANQGMIRDLGASLSGFVPSDNLSIARVQFEVTRQGDASLSLRPSLSAYLDTTIFGRDGDQRSFSQYDSQDILFQAPLPDLAVSNLHVTSSVAEQGVVELNYMISNYGGTANKGFWAKLYLSDDSSLNNSVDTLVWQRYFEADSITGLGNSGSQKQLISLPRDILLGHALAEDSAGPGLGSISNHKDWLFLSIMPDAVDGDSLESNNTKATAITYFPWDIDGNGRVTIADSMSMLNSIGPAPSVNSLTAIQDLDGNGFVEPIEIMAVRQRVGLNINLL